VTLISRASMGQQSQERESSKRDEDGRQLGSRGSCASGGVAPPTSCFIWRATIRASSSRHSNS